MKILEVKNLEKRYRGFHLKVNFQIESGECNGFVGRNGAGKTTTIGLIANIIKKDSGKVLLFGKDNIKYEVQAKQKMGIIFEDHQFYPQLKVKKILKFCSSLYSDWDWKYTDILVKKFDLPLDKRFGYLSKGMKKKLLLIISLSPHPKLLLFDEPISDLDPKAKYDVVEELIRAKEEWAPAIFFSSHNISELSELSEKVIFIDQGQIIQNDRKINLLSKWKKIHIIDDKILNISGFNDIIHSRYLRGNTREIIVNNYSDKIIKEIREKSRARIDVFDMNLEQIFLESIKEK